MGRESFFKKESFDDYYIKIKEIVSKGFSIQEACKSLGLSRAVFYREVQKLENGEVLLKELGDISVVTKGHFKENKDPGIKPNFDLDNEEDY